MLRKTQILLLGWAMLSITSGCYREAYRGDALSLEDEQVEPTTQPMAEPTEAAPAETPPLVEEPALPPAVAPKEAAPVVETPDVGRKIRAIIQTNFGHMEAELWPDQAPKTVENFTALAESGFYQDLPCHRMIPGFIVQLGKPTSAAKRQTLQPIKGEFSKTLKHEGGTLSMARRPKDPDSATSQFFICFRPKNDVQRRALASLDGNYAIFGKIVRGLDVLDQIEGVPTTTQPRGREAVEPSKPTRTILLNSVRIVE